MVFPVAMYGCESWTVKKAERRRIDAFELWYWKRLESPLDCKEIQSVNPKGNQYWIFIGRTDAEAEALMLWPPDVKNWFIGKDLDAGKDWEGDNRGWDGWMASLIQWTSVWTSSRRWRTGKPGVLQSIGLQRVRHNWATEQQQQKVACVVSDRTRTQTWMLWLYSSISFHWTVPHIPPQGFIIMMAMGLLISDLGGEKSFKFRIRRSS